MPPIILFVIALSVLIIAHELGHFLMAKRKGVLIEEFGLGYPPRIWAKKIGETIYSLNWIPAGGFVKILGELETAKDDKLPANLRSRSLAKQSLAVRIAVSLGGVTMNLLLGIFIFSLVYSVLGIPKKTDRILVVGVAEDSPAKEAGLIVGDWLIGVYEEGGLKEVKEMETFIEFSSEHAGETITVLVGRKKEDEWQKLVVSLVPRKDPPEGEGPLGVIISQTETYKPPLWKRPFLGVKEGFSEAFFWGKMIVGGIKEMLFNALRGKAPENIAGPVGIYQATSEIQKRSGIWAVFHFFGVLSVNLAIVNLLPFPALDGSHLVFLALEAVTKKKPNPKIKRVIYQTGMIFLLLLLFLVTWGDIRRLKNGS